MGYRSDVRIVTSKKGYEELKKFSNNYLKKYDKEIAKFNIINNCDVFKQGDNEIYMGWNGVKWDEGYSEVDAIMAGLEHLDKNDYSFRYARIGEDYCDFESNYINSVKKEKNIKLDYPYLERYFCDDYLYYMNQSKQKNKSGKEER